MQCKKCGGDLPFDAYGNIRCQFCNAPNYVPMPEREKEVIIKEVEKKESSKGLLVLIIIILLIGLGYVLSGNEPSSKPVYARDYGLKSATVEVIIDSDGIVHVTETISYTFTGIYKEVFRQVYPPPGGAIKNIEIKCLGQPCTARVDTISGGYELVGVLPQPTPSEIVFVVSYDYYGGLKVYDDISELHYKLWGEDWEKPLGRMEATIHLPQGAGVDAKYWLHPKEYTRKDQLDGDTIVIETGKIPSKKWYEVRVAFPRLENPDSNYVSIQKGSGLEKIIEIESAYT